MPANLATCLPIQKHNKCLLLSRCSRSRLTLRNTVPLEDRNRGRMIAWGTHLLAHLHYFPRSGVDWIDLVEDENISYSLNLALNIWGHFIICFPLVYFIDFFLTETYFIFMTISTLFFKLYKIKLGNVYIWLVIKLILNNYKLQLNYQLVFFFKCRLK